MVGPVVQARVKQRDPFSSSSITGSVTGRLAQRAGDARESQIIERRVTTARAGLNVVNMKRRFLRVLWEQTILAEIAGPYSDFASQAMRNMTTHAPSLYVVIVRDALCSQLHKRQHFSELRERLGLAALSFCEFALVILLIEQILQTSVQRSGESKSPPVAGEVELKQDLAHDRAATVKLKGDSRKQKQRVTLLSNCTTFHLQCLIV